MSRCPSLRTSVPLFVWVAMMLCVRAALAQQPDRAGMTGEQLFKRACVACHAADGKGQPLEVRGFEVDPPDFTVALNGQIVNQFHFTGDPQSPRRGLPSTPQQPRFIGLQTHTGQALFRRIQWKAL